MNKPYQIQKTQQLKVTWQSQLDGINRILMKNRFKTLPTVTDKRNPKDASLSPAKVSSVLFSLFLFYFFIYNIYNIIN